MLMRRLRMNHTELIKDLAEEKGLSVTMVLKKSNIMVGKYKINLNSKEIFFDNISLKLTEKEKKRKSLERKQKEPSLRYTEHHMVLALHHGALLLLICLQTCLKLEILMKELEM